MRAEAVAPGASALDVLKDRLDLFAELLMYHGQLCRAWYATSDSECDRAVFRNASKAFIDIARYGAAADVSPLESRRRATERIIRNSASSHHPLVADFVAWQARGYAPWHGGRALIAQAQHAAFVTVRDRARELSADGIHSGLVQELCDVQILSDEYQRDTLRRNHPDAWRLAADAILDRATRALKAVWPSYYHLYLIVDDGAHSKMLTETGAAADEVLNEHRQSLFPRSSRMRPALRCRPMLLPESALQPLLHSCYLNKPFKYYDFMHEHLSSRTAGLKDRVQPPSAELLTKMAVEAVSHLALTIRLDLGRIESVDQIYRTFLRVLGLVLFIERDAIVLPLAKLVNVFRTEFPEERVWIDRLEQECGSESPNDREKASGIFYRYYPHVKRLLDRLIMRLGYGGSLVPSPSSGGTRLEATRRDTP